MCCLYVADIIELCSQQSRRKNCYSVASLRLLLLGGLSSSQCGLSEPSRIEPSPKNIDCTTSIQVKSYCELWESSVRLDHKMNQLIAIIKCTILSGVSTHHVGDVDSLLLFTLLLVEGGIRSV